MNVLTLVQRDLLSSFFSQSASAPFVLTGGTALAAFHLRHRLSEDVDLFASAPIGDEELRRSEILELGFQAAIDSGAMIGAQVESRAPSAHFHQVFLTRGDEPRLKIDLVRDPGPSFGEPLVIDGIRVDSMLNIAVNKVTALSRLAARDYIDLFFLSQQGFEFDDLLKRAKQKDLGLEEFYLAMALRAVAKISESDLPKMLKPLNLDEMKDYFQALAIEITKRIKPE
jgi:hypothetical protein